MMTALEPRLYLASRSPRRRELLAQIGVHFEPLLFRGGSRQDREVIEDTLPNELPGDYVRRLALAKASHGVQLCRVRNLPQRPVLSADTTLDVDGEIIGKPRDEADAVAILTRLSGRTHRVLTAVAVADEIRREHTLSISEVRFRALDEDEIHRYALTGEPMDKAGAYGIQGRAAMFVEEIRGSHSGIVGLPLCETVLLLRRFNYPI
jgi:septum formation protein